MYSGRTEETFQARWDRMYELAERYYAGHGDLLIPGDYKTPCGKRLGRWIGTQRQDAKKGAPAFTGERRRRLETIGMVWDVKELSWERMFAAASRYSKQHGDLRVPAQYETGEGLRLGEWICRTRQRYREGSLSADRIGRLEGLGMVWGIKEELADQWDGYYGECLTYLQAHGGVHVPKKQKARDGTCLGEWLCRQKSAYRGNSLSEEHRRKLEMLKPDVTVLEHQWQAWFSEAERFYNAHASLIVPRGTACSCGDLHAWINTQRLQYGRGALDPEKIALLERIGIIWRVWESGWEGMYRRAEQYYDKHGDLMVPRDYREDRALSVWITNQRKDHRQGRSTLTAERIARLDRLGMSWVPYGEAWEERYAIARAFYEANGHLEVKKKSKLRQWVLQQRAAKRRGALSPEREERLNAVGMRWDVFEERWERMYGQAKAYYAIHEQLNIPANYVTPEGLRLGAWICGQRQLYKRLMTVSDPKIQRRFGRLNEIGMIWDASKLIYFTSFPEQAVMFYDRRTFPDAGKMNTWETYGIEIDVYVPDLRAGIEYDGVFHHDKRESDASKDRVCREQGIRLFRIREPGLPALPDAGEVLHLADSSAGELDRAICEVLARLGAAPSDVDTERDRPAILEAYRNLNASVWDRMYETAYRYFAAYGSLEAGCEPPEQTAPMRGWLTKQRRNYYDGLLTARQARKLMKLRFLDGAMPMRRRSPADRPAVPGRKPEKRTPEEKANQTAARRERTAREQWERMYELARAYSMQNGSLLAPFDHVCGDGSRLGVWVSAQRRRYQQSELSYLEIQRLEGIHMVWDPKGQAIRQWMHAARAYHRTYGHVNAPLEYLTPKGQHLGAWISNMRSKYKRGTLEPDIVRLLERLGVSWYPLDQRWEFMYGQAAAFYGAHGHLNVPASYHVPGGATLLVWIQLQRQKYLKKDYARGILTEEQVKRLNEIGMVWLPFAERWMENYELAKAYYLKNGHLRIPGTYVTEDGRKLGMWISTQRQAHRGNPNYHMTEQKRLLLEAIGMDWRTRDRGRDGRGGRGER